MGLTPSFALELEHEPKGDSWKMLQESSPRCQALESSDGSESQEWPRPGSVAMTVPLRAVCPRVTAAGRFCVFSASVLSSGR